MSRPKVAGAGRADRATCADRRGRASCIAENLEERVLMALAKAAGGSGYSANLSTNPTIRQQQLICDPDEPAAGSTSVLYDAGMVTLRGASPGPGYENLDGVVEVRDPTGGRTFLQRLVDFLRQPAGLETGFVQLQYTLTGEAGQMQPQQGFTVVDDGGVDGVDTHALTFALLKDTPIDAAVRYTVFAAPAGSHSDNKSDYLMLNDGTGRVLGPAELSPAQVSSRPDLDTIISVGDVVALEGSGNPAGILIGLSRAVQGPVSVSFATTDGTATDGKDYKGAKGTLTFAPGETSKVLPIDIIDDKEPEPDETFFLKLFEPRGASFAGGVREIAGTGMIVDDDPPAPPPTPSVSVCDVAVEEGDTGTTPAAFVVKLSNPSATPVTVNFATADRTATAGADYRAAGGTMTFAPGETEKPITVAVIGDTLDESDETFYLDLTAATGATIADPRGFGTILEDDDRLPAVQLHAVPAATPDQPVDEARISFSEPVKGFDLSELVLTRNDQVVPLSGVSLVGDGNVWSLRGLAPLNANPGHYVLTLPGGAASGITDLAGNPLADGASDSWDVLRRGVPPVVTQVYVAGSGWTSAYRSYLQSKGLGDATFGYAVPAGPAQLDELPWGNLNQVSIRFDKDVLVLDVDLAVRGVNVASYDIKSFDYDDATHTATWTLARPVLNDKLLLDLNGGGDGVVDAEGIALDGDWANGSDSFPSGDGVPGGDLRFRLNVLSGDLNRDGKVTYFDWLELRRRLGRSIQNPGPASGPAPYGAFFDANGDGSINTPDFLAVRRDLLQSLPGGTPAQAAAAGPSVTSITKELFASRPITV